MDKDDYNSFCEGNYNSIRKVLFDKNNKVIPHVKHQLRIALYLLGGCPILMKRGVRKGESCGKRIYLQTSLLGTSIGCSYHGHHPHPITFCKKIFDIIKKIEEEKEDNKYTINQIIKTLSQYYENKIDPEININYIDELFQTVEFRVMGYGIPYTYT